MNILVHFVICIYFFFLGLENLDSLILAHNMITEVPANVFSHLGLLNSLELEGNKIYTIDKDAFKGLEGKQCQVTFKQTKLSKKSLQSFPIKQTNNKLRNHFPIWF